MWPETRWSLLLLGGALVVFGIGLIVRRRSADPTVDSPAGRLAGGLALLALGLVIGAVGINLIATGR